MNEEHNFLGLVDDQAATIDVLGRLLAQHKLVPFFGAGVSRRHLGFAGRELAMEMAGILGKPTDTVLSMLADNYIESHGEEGFAAFLRTKLTVEELDESRAPTHRLILSLSSRVIYTTNQDNLFELTAAHYGRPYRRVVTLQDLSEAIPGEPMLIKFHGDPEIPESLVFGAKSYQQRLTTKRHPLDIRLQSDLLGKQLLFIGYSLQDENVTKLLAAVKEVFSGNMPPSYLVAFEYDSSMQDLANAYGVQVINPSSFFPEHVTAADAFERFLKAVCDSTIEHQAKRGLDDLFNGKEINPRMVTEFELAGLARVVETEPFEYAISAFRGLLDDARVPKNLLDFHIEIFRKLTERADPKSEDEMNEFKGVLFNFRVPPSHAALALTYVMVACNQRPSAHGFDDFVVLTCPALPDGARPIAAAMAVALLRQRGEVITDNFRRLARSWFEGYEDVHASILDNVKLMISEAWAGDKAAQSPLTAARFPFRPKEFHSILNDLTRNWPKKFQTPEE